MAVRATFVPSSTPRLERLRGLMGTGRSAPTLTIHREACGLDGECQWARCNPALTPASLRHLRSLPAVERCLGCVWPEAGLRWRGLTSGTLPHPNRRNVPPGLTLSGGSRDVVGGVPLVAPTSPRPGSDLPLGADDLRSRSDLRGGCEAPHPPPCHTLPHFTLTQPQPDAKFQGLRVK